MADEFIKRAQALKPPTIEEAYNYGYDCGLHGSNETNTAFTIFQSLELTAAWTEGKNDAKESKPNKHGK